MIRTLRLLQKHVRNRRYLEDGPNFRRDLRKTDSRLFTSENLSNSEKQSELYRHLYTRIKACGPITVADYMKTILTTPNEGYYMTKDVFGHKGDFTTSPEVSQLFGEMLGLWISYEVRKIHRGPVQIVELGPGRGTLAKDILRTVKQLKIVKNVSIHLVEISPTLSKIQAETLCKNFEDNDPAEKVEGDSVSHYRKGITEDGVEVYWYYSVKDVPRKFSVFLAQEFFDALPIHKFQKTEKGWSEVMVDIIEGQAEEKFKYVLSPTATPASSIYVSPSEERDHVEVSPDTMVIIDHISQFLWENGGFTLIIDYGHAGEKTDTFRGFRQHQLHDPLLNPGSADLTADVDFSLIKKIAEKNERMITFGPITQRTFLMNIGINVRLGRLLSHATKEQIKQLEFGYHMIMDEDKMGTRFKALSIFPSAAKQVLDKHPVLGFKSTDEKPRK